MPSYKYTAVDNTGKQVKGTVTAFDIADIETRLTENELTLITYKPLKEWPDFSLLGSNKVKPRDLIEFYYQFSQTLSLGFPILEALDENSKTLPSKPLRKVAGELRVAIEAGRSLFDAMSSFPKTFQKLDLAIVNLGEQTGVLPKSMKDLAEFLKWKEDIVSTIQKAAIYPVIVLFVIMAVIGVWVGYVLPQMAKMLVDMGVTLPPITQVILNISIFLQSYWLHMLAGILTVSIALYLFQKTKNGGILFHKYLLKVPIVGLIASNIAVARLSRNFAAMYSAGMIITKIFEILSSNVVGNRYLEQRISVVYQNVRTGHSIAKGFENAGGFPPILVGAIRNGEATGTIDEAFTRLGDYFDTEVKRSVQALVSAIGPLTIVILGTVFGVVLLSIMLPLYDVIGNLEGSY